MHSAVVKLADLCQAWGGNLTIIDSASFDQTVWREEWISLWRKATAKRGWHPSPSNEHTAIHAPTGTILVRDGHTNVNAIIHEMGHVFCEPNKIENADEFSWLGFEIALARYVDAFKAWDADNGNYFIGDDEAAEWSELSRRRKAYVIQERLIEANALGLIDDYDRPTPKRFQRRKHAPSSKSGPRHGLRPRAT